LKIFELIENNYNLTKTTTQVERGNLNWYNNAGLTIIKLSEELNVERKVFETFILHHIFDTLSFEDKKQLIVYLTYKEIKNIDFTELEKTLYDYINNYIKIITTENDDDEKVEGYILYDSTLNVYIYDKTNHILEIPLPLEKTAILKKAIKNKYELQSYNNIVGFMGYIEKTNDIAFKTKYIDLKRNKGSRCDQAGKSATIKISNDIYGDNRYTKENTKDMKAIQMCSEQELYLRYKQSIEKDDKVWFLNLEQSVINNIENITRFKK
jgi:hypothetical protein